MGDAPLLPELLSQIPPDQEIASVTASVTADGTCDTRKCHDAIAERGAETKMHCVKLLGQRLMARGFDLQVAEFQVRGRSERLHRAWHTRHKGRRTSLSGVRGSLAIKPFVQQSPSEPPLSPRHLCR